MPLKITKRLTPTSKATAIHSVAQPAAARTRTAALNVSASSDVFPKDTAATTAQVDQFAQSTQIGRHHDRVGRLQRRVAGPVPNAIPRGDAASAGASFTPSPTIARHRVAAEICLTRATLSSGRSSAWTSSIPTARATASATPRPSPVSITMRRTPSSRSRARARAASGRGGSANRSTPQIDSDVPTNAAVVESLLVHAGGLGPGARTDRHLRIEKQPRRAHVKRLVPKRTADAEAAQRREVAGLRLGQSTPPGLSDDRPGQRMLAMVFQRGRRFEDLAFAAAGQGFDRDDPRLARRQRAGLVQGHRVDPAGVLQVHAALDQDAASRRAKQPGDDRHRRGNHQRHGQAITSSTSPRRSHSMAGVCDAQPTPTYPSTGGPNARSTARRITTGV